MTAMGALRDRISAAMRRTSWRRAEAAERGAMAPLPAAGRGADRAAAPARDDADELAALIAAHARATASPDADALARMRDEILRTFMAADGQRTAASSGRTHRPRPLRLAAFLAAAALVLLGAGGVLAAAEPGGPLYGARVDLEALALPKAATPAWYDAEAGRLGARINEVEAAARADNPVAMEAAAGAYETILAQTVDVAGPASNPRSIPPGLQRALDRHEALLAALIPRAPAPAKAALEAALGRLQQAATGERGPAGPATAPAGQSPGSDTGPSTSQPTTRPGHAGNPPGLEKKPKASEPPDDTGTSGSVTAPGTGSGTGSGTQTSASPGGIAAAPDAVRVVGLTASTRPSPVRALASESARMSAPGRATASGHVPWWRQAVRQLAQLRRTAA